MWNPGPHQPLWNILASRSLLCSLTFCSQEFIYIYKIREYFLMQREELQFLCLPLRGLSPSCSLVVDAGAFCKVWPVANRSSGGLKGSSWPISSAHAAQLCCQVSHRGCSLCVADFCTEQGKHLLLKSICLLLATRSVCPYC